MKHLWLLFLLTTTKLTQTLELSGEWRRTLREDLANALPQTSDHDWTRIELRRDGKNFGESF